MKKQIIFLLLSFCIINFCHAKNLCNIDPELQQIIKQRNNDFISINIILKSQVDVNNFKSRSQAFSDNKEKRDAVLKEFKNFSKASQSDVLSILQAETRSNNVRDIKCHWITNMINCSVTSDVVYRLAEHPDIEAIAYNKLEYMLFDEEPQTAAPVRGMTDNITMINADDVWEQGFTGKGILVSILDTGVNIDHLDLKDHLWDGGNAYPNHGFNTYNNNHDITDAFGHGTHCAGTICGDGTSGTQTGIAPNATLMCVKVLGDEGYGSVSATLSGVEFSVENGADVLNLSLGASFSNTFTNELYRSAFENLLELNVLAVIAAGNDRGKIKDYPIPRNITSPAVCPPAWIHPDQQGNIGGTSSTICIGAVNYNDDITSFSSEGPATWAGSKWGDYVLDMSTELAPGWLDYDNNKFATGVGVNPTFKWGVMFTPSKLKNYENGKLTTVSMYDCVAHTGDIEIYQGGSTPNEGTLIHTQEFSCTGSNGFVEFDITTALTIDHTKNLWIILSTDDGDFKPAAACKSIHDPNGRWLGLTYENYTEWLDICEWYEDHNYTWMLRAFVSSDNGDLAQLRSEENNEIGLIRPDICAPGYGIVSASHLSDNGHISLNGTSMAAPCVTGAVALLLEKNPNLTPARICEILETSAVKLTNYKSNRTGSGRIDIEAAMKLVDAPAPKPEAPVLKATVSNDTIYLTWNAIEGATKYNIYHEGKMITYVSGDRTSAIATDLSPDYEYCFTVTASSENGESEHSNEVCASISGTGIDEATSSLAIFPNPVENKLIISTNETIKEIKIHNIVGMTIYSNDDNVNSIDMTHFHSGIYFIKIKTDKGITVKQFIKK